MFFLYSLFVLNVEQNKDKSEDTERARAPHIKTKIKYATNKQELLQRKKSEEKKLLDSKAENKTKNKLSAKSEIEKTHPSSEPIAKKQTQIEVTQTQKEIEQEPQSCTEIENNIKATAVAEQPDAEVASEFEEEAFDLLTLTEEDTKHFKSFVYKGSDACTRPTTTKFDFMDIVVAFDENEKHTWSVTENFCIYECAPTSSNTAKNASIRQTAHLAKKRKIRVLSTSENEETQQVPSATSTPLIQKKVAKPTEMEKKETSLQDITADSIKIDDIESILSHLHGT